MSLCLEMSYNDIGDELARWNQSTELVSSLSNTRRTSTDGLG